MTGSKSNRARGSSAHGKDLAAHAMRLALPLEQERLTYRLHGAVGKNGTHLKDEITPN